jgi:hypothetical protein
VSHELHEEGSFFAGVARLEAERDKATRRLEACAPEPGPAVDGDHASAPRDINDLGGEREDAAARVRGREIAYWKADQPDPALRRALAEICDLIEVRREGALPPRGNLNPMAPGRPVVSRCRKLISMTVAGPDEYHDLASVVEGGAVALLDMMKSRERRIAITRSTTQALDRGPPRGGSPGSLVHA